MRSWVYGASYGAASSVIVLVAASLLVPPGEVISDDPPSAQVNSEDLMATVNAESKAVTTSAADPVTPGQSVASKPEEPAGEAQFGVPEIVVAAPEIAELNLVPKAAPGSEPGPRPLMIGDGIGRVADLVVLQRPYAEILPLLDVAKPPYYGATLIQPETPLAEPTPAPEPEPDVMAAPSGDEVVEASLPRTESRLPQIGGDGLTVVEPEAASEAAAPTDAMLTNSAAWPDPGLPKIAVILTGAGADFAVPVLEDVPVSVVVDALSDTAGDLTSSVRAAGQEVVIATPLPQGATASDVQVAFEAYQAQLAGGVAVIEPEDGSFRARAVAEAVVDLALARGLGLVSVSQGLNPVRQLAGPAGAHAGLVEEDLAAVAGDAGAFARALDKAAFKAGQDGSVILLAPATPEVVAALKDWAQSARGKTVSLAPVSAVLAGL